MRDTLTTVEPDTRAWRLFKDEGAANDIAVITSKLEDDDPFSRIRCPLCRWQPTASSRWRCLVSGTPEPPFDACGAVWNTFSTGGRCPGCRHQWRWTTCLRCLEHSLHKDWYASEDEG